MDQATPNSETMVLERINRELSTLYELSATIIQSINVAEFLQTLIERAGQILQVQSGSIVLPDPDGFLRIKAYFGFKEEHARGYKLRHDEGRGGSIFTSGKAQMFVTSQNEAGLTFHPITHQEGIEHTIGAPMIGSNHEVIGVLFLNDKISSEPFNESELKILENFANLAAIAVEKQGQLEELNRQKERYRELSEKLEASFNELNAVNERLRDSNKLKDEVLSICAHDVRSPLTAIVSYAELLLASDNLSDKQQRYLAHIHRSSGKINSLVQNLLIRARYLESDEPLRFESVSMGRLAREAIQQIEDRLASKKIQAGVYDQWQRRIRADRFKLAQVIDNLIDNAEKFTPDEGEIRIDIHAAESLADHIEVVISNTGEGIPAEALPRLFLRYFQVSSNKQRSGYGLGLAICKQNVELHGGTISAESDLNERTAFRFTLPIGRPYLLVLSADGGLIEELAALLPANEEWRFESVDNEKACIDLITTELPTLLVIDNGVSELNVLELLNRIRREYDLFRQPIVVIGNRSAGSNEQSELSELASLAQYHSRPLTFDQLLTAIKE